MNTKFNILTLFTAVLALAIGGSAFVKAHEDAEQAGGIQWMTLEEVEAAQKVEAKPVLVDLYTSWCVWCTKMDENTFTEPSLASYINKNFYAVKFDAEADVSVSVNGQDYQLTTVNNRKVHQLAWTWGAENNRIGYPTTVILGSDMNKLQAFPGYKDVDAMSTLARYFGEGIYQSKSWQDYLSSGK